MLCAAGDLSPEVTDLAWRKIVFNYMLNGHKTSITMPEVLLVYESQIRDLTRNLPRSPITISFAQTVFFAAQRAYMKTQNLQCIIKYHKWRKEIVHRGVLRAPSAKIEDAVACGIKECLGLYCKAVHDSSAETNSLVIMGHTHGPLIQNFADFTYINSGGWASTGKDSQFAYVEVYENRIVLNILHPSKSPTWEQQIEKLDNHFM